MNIKNKTKAEVINELGKFRDDAVILGLRGHAEAINMEIINLNVFSESYFECWVNQTKHAIDASISTVTKKKEELVNTMFSKDWDELLESKVFERSQNNEVADLPISATQINALKHHPSIVEDQYKTLAFTNVIPADMAQRLIGDLEYIVEHTNDEKYISALQAEIKRLGYIARGEITKPSDVNYAWTIRIE